MGRWDQEEIVRADEYVRLDGIAMSDAIAAGETTPVELIDAAITQIERLNHDINAVVHKTYDRARRIAADGLPSSPLHGVPFLVKDLAQSVAGSPMTMGSKSLQFHIASSDSNLVRRYREAGLSLLGKTNTPEFGNAATTEPELHGPTHNPWELGTTAGGSSGGAAAAVAARFVPVAHASDGGGSIRIPASVCGLFGLKPTRARTPKGPDTGEGWFGLSVDHAVSVTVRDSAALLDVSHGPDIGAPYYPPPPSHSYLSEVGRAPGRLRIAISTGALLGDHIDAECVTAVEQTAQLLEDLGHEVEHATPTADATALGRHFVVMLAAATADGITKASAVAGRDPDPNLFEDANWLLGLIGKKLSAEDLAAALSFVRLESRRVAAFFEDYDVLVESTLAQPPWKVGDLDPSPTERRLMEMAKRIPSRRFYRRIIEEMAPTALERFPNTPMWNVTGQPSMSVPLATSTGGLPVGVQFTARYADEATLFRLAAQLESARPWRDAIPPMAQPV